MRGWLSVLLIVCVLMIINISIHYTIGKPLRESGWWDKPASNEVAILSAFFTTSILLTLQRRSK